MKRLLLRVVVILAIVEVSYLVVVNAALNLPATQTWINQLRPERFLVHWDQAWSWFPFRLQATGFSVNGQSWSQQFEMSAPSVSTSLSILPLFAGTLEFADLETADIAVHFRPRPSPDKDDGALRQYYPTIPGRDPNLAADPVPSETPGWRTVFDVTRIGGKNDIWLAAVRMTVGGEAAAKVIRQNRNGPLTISGGEADLSVSSFTIAGREASTNGSIKGTFDFATFLPQENRGLKLLGFLSLDADIDVPVEGLDFLDFFLTTVSDMTLGGNGGLKGHVAYNKGNLAPGTDLTVTADRLTLDLPPYAVRGRGTVAIAVDATAPETLGANFNFKTLSTFREPEHETLFTGADLAVAVVRAPRILPGADVEKVPRQVSVTIPNVTVPDVSVYQRFLPDNWDVDLLGGAGSLDGQAQLSGPALDFKLTLRSDDAEIKLTKNSFETGLVLGLQAKGEAGGKTAQIDISGTYLDLDDSRVKTGKGDRSAPWQTRLDVTQGNAVFPLPDQSDPAAGIVGFWSLFRAEDLKTLLAKVDGRVQAGLTVSDLDWVNLLIKNPFSLAIYDAAEVQADLTVTSGFLAAGSTVKSPPRDFRLDILDYVVEGSGGFALTVEKGGEHPDVRLDANLADASLRLQDEKTAVVDAVTLAMTATAEGVSLTDGGSVKTVEMSIPSAKITDMAAYNSYLPEGSPVRILGGTADVSAKLTMQEDTATGFVRLKTSRVRADLDGEQISGTIGLDVAIKGGSAKDKRFNISGSSLTVDDVSVVGEHATTGDWSGEVDLAKANVVWKQPMTLDVNASIRMTDARPLLAIFSADRKTNRWLDHLLDLKNIKGDATINVAPKQFVVPYAFATSDTIDVGAKGVISGEGRQGVFYARYGKLAGILAIDNDDERFELIDATRKFEDYVPGGPLPAMEDPPYAATEATRPSFSIFKRR